MKTSIEKKLLRTFLTIVGSMMLVVLVLFVAAMQFIRSDVSQRTAQMGTAAASSSQELLIDQSLTQTTAYVEEKADSINRQIDGYISQINILVNAAAHIYENPQFFIENEQVRTPDEQIALGLTQGNVMEWIPCDVASDTPENLAQCRRLGSLYGVLDPILQENPEITLLYIVTQSGYTFGIDGSILSRAGVDYYEARTLDYFRIPMEGSDIYISPVYEDSFGKGSMITISRPIFVHGEAIGVFAADILVEDLKTSVLEASLGDMGGAMLLDQTGALICASDSLSPHILDTREQLAQQFSTSQGGSITVEKDGETDYLLYQPIPATGWTIAVSISHALVIAPAQQASAQIDGLTQTLLTDLNDIVRLISIVTALLLIAALLALLVIVRRVCRDISRPVEQLTQQVEAIGEGELDFHNTIRTGDEIELLGDSFETMTKSLKEYIANLTAVTAEKERIGAELGVATQIQASMLPCIFPAFPGRPEFDIYASMTPAKEVGGDFYDFFLVDDDHLALVMADVSGKGVPAALFMVIAKTLLKNCAQTGLAPKDILEKVNNQLCENNEAEMFVTVWLGILEISTGKLTAANAGHEYPALRRAGGDFELVIDKHGFVMAGMENARYPQYELQLEKGDRLYVYTDGVAEATDAHDELYGTDRMLVALNRHRSATPAQLLPLIKEDIDAFVGEAPQFDDITMLTLELR